MPPWYIEKDIGIQDYKGDVSLSDEEVAAIARWVDNGAPRGNPADAPPLLEFPDASVWTIGEPDLIVSSPSVEIGASDPDWWGPIGQVAVEGLSEDRYVAAIEMKEINDVEPTGGRDTVGSRWGIHHLVWNAVHPDEYTVEELEALRESDPDEYARVVGVAAIEGGFWPVHEVGRNADYFDPKAGLLLRAGSNIVFSSAHLHSTGTHMKSRLDIGFKFHPRDYEPEYTNMLLAYGTGDLDIRGGTANQKIESVQDAAVPREADHLRAAPARGRHADVPRRDLPGHGPDGDAELRRLQPFLGAGVLLCRGRRPGAAEGYGAAHHGLLRHLARQQERGRSAQLGRNGRPLDRQHADQPGAGCAALGRGSTPPELEQRRRALNLTPGQYVTGCPGCGAWSADAGQNQDQ